MVSVFVCDRGGSCQLGHRLGDTVPQVRVRRKGRSARATAQSAADDFFSDETNLGQRQVEVTVEEEEQDED